MDPVRATPLDTAPEAWEAQLALLRRMGGPRRAALAFRLTRMAREASRAGIRARHPDYGEEESVARLVRRLEALGIPYMVAGSVASSHHGLPRGTAPSVARSSRAARGATSAG